MPRTWWPPVIQGMEGTSLWLQFSEAGCLWRRSMSSCWAFRTKTHPTLLSGSPTMSRLQYVISHLEDSRWLQLSLGTLQPSRSSSRGLGNNSLPCLDGRPSFIGTQVFLTTFISVISWQRPNSRKDSSITDYETSDNVGNAIYIDVVEETDYRYKTSQKWLML